MTATRVDATINTSITLDASFFNSVGQKFDPFSIDRVDIMDSTTNEILESITSITYVSQGSYLITTSSTWNTSVRTVLDLWYYTPTDGAAQLSTCQSTVINIGTPGNMVTASDIRNKFLKGLPLTDVDGEDIEDSTLEQMIDAAIGIVERELRIDIKQKVVRSTPAPGEVFDVEEPNYDYDLNDYWKWGFMKLYRMPVQSIIKMEFIYPTGQKIMDIPTSWLKLRKDHGQVNLVPTAGSLSQVMIGSGYYLPMLTAGVLGDLPSMMRIAYITGFKTIPNDIWNAIGKVASIEVLTLLDANSQALSSSSISADGLNLSYSRTNSPSQVLYQARIDQYSKWLETFYPDAMRYYHGSMFTVA